MSRRNFNLIKAGAQAFAFDVMVFGETLSDKKPLLILHSIEFPLPPSERFCDAMWQAGFQIIFVRRASYGRSSPLPEALMSDELIRSGATAMAEAVMVRALMSQLKLSHVTLLAMGSSNLVAYRLVKLAPEIDYTVFANPVFNQDIFDVFTPAWFRSMLRDIVTSKSGLKVAIQGMKLFIRNDPVSFYQHIFEKNADDLQYVQDNQDDYRSAGAFALDITPAQLHYEAKMLLTEDPMLKDGFFNGTRGSILIGRDSSQHWRTQMQIEGTRVGLPVIMAPRGDLLSAYVSTKTLLSAIQNQSSPQARKKVADL